MSIRTKILLPMVAIAIICALTISVIAIAVVKAFTNDFNDQQLSQAETLATTLLEQRSLDAEQLSAMVASNEQLIEEFTEYIADGNRQKMVDVSISLLDSAGVDFLTVMDKDGNVIVRAHEPDNFGDSLANQANVKAAMSGRQYTTTEKGSAVKLSVRSGTPIFDLNGGLIGVVSLGYRLDQSGFADYIKQMTNTEVSVFLADSCISTTLLNEKGERAVDVKASEVVTQQVFAGNNYIGRINDFGANLYINYSPIRDAENAVLGMLAIGLDTSNTDNRIIRDIWITAIFVVLLSFAAGLVSLNVSSRIVRPISEMSDAARKLAEGDVDVEISVALQTKSKDETVHLARAFSDMINANRERARIIGAVADGDLRDSINPKSDKDIVGIALAELLEKNNTSFKEMNQAAAQLDMTSAQLASGAQSLSQDASRQASTIEHLNLQLKDLSGRVTEEANNAKQSTKLSESVKEYAEKGSHQMAQMMDAVEQISKATDAIGKVISVIDGIAFQTNILALNAAVEAARAGQHGKGFAVVAEEVRNLASKSADAAKDTGALIANSIEKAKLGAQISADTAASFADIVNGINDSTAIVDTIAKFMQSQKEEIENIVRGVDEIGTLVTSVTASAEQSASASEEMNSQAALMATTLSEYKLRDFPLGLPGNN